MNPLVKNPLVKKPLVNGILVKKTLVKSTLWSMGLWSKDPHRQKTNFDRIQPLTKDDLWWKGVDPLTRVPLTKGYFWPEFFFTRVPLTRGFLTRGFLTRGFLWPEGLLDQRFHWPEDFLTRVTFHQRYPMHYSWPEDKKIHFNLRLGPKPNRPGDNFWKKNVFIQGSPLCFFARSVSIMRNNSHSDYIGAKHGV